MGDKLNPKKNKAAEAIKPSLNIIKTRDDVNLSNSKKLSTINLSYRKALIVLA
jgi:hypothetical protein